MNQVQLDEKLNKILSKKKLKAEYSIGFVEEVFNDLDVVKKSGKLSHVLTSLCKLAVNPLTRYQGGYGEPLGNKYNYDLTGCSAVKIKGQTSIRIVYKIVPDESDDDMVKVIVIGVKRDYNEVYREAHRRLIRHFQE